MCTLSLFKDPNGYRIFMNRDERHDRQEEQTPQILSQKQKIYGPLDPQSGGTWIAYNNNGYWGALLNGYHDQDKTSDAARQSRGHILLEILQSDNPLTVAETLNPQNYNSFCLIIGNSHTHRLMRWDGRDYHDSDFCTSYDDRIFFTTSSSLDQERVRKTRIQIFQDWTNNIHTYHGDIPSYHFSKDPHLDYSIMMKRSYSMTKSITSISVCDDTMTMSYWSNNQAAYSDERKAV